MSKAQSENQGGKGKLSFLLGAFVGAVAGTVSWILLAPRELKQQADDSSESFKDKALDAAAGAKDRLSETKDTAMYIAEGVGEVISEYTAQGKDYLTDKKGNLGGKLGEALQTGRDAFFRRKDELEDQKDNES